MLAPCSAAAGPGLPPPLPQHAPPACCCCAVGGLVITSFSFGPLAFPVSVLAALASITIYCSFAFAIRCAALHTPGGGLRAHL